MKITRFLDSEGGIEAWLVYRLGKISGSRVKDILPGRNGEIKKAIWELAAERLTGSIALVDDEKPMDRGKRLEPVAMERFIKETGKKVDATLLTVERDDDSSIMVSPDGIIGKTAAIEIKCLSSASHLEAKVNGKIPKNTCGYEEQAAQYFITNDKLRTLYFVFYDDRFPTPLDFFYLTITRKELKAEIAEWLELERKALAQIRDIVNKVSFN